MCVSAGTPSPHRTRRRTCANCVPGLNAVQTLAVLLVMMLGIALFTRDSETLVRCVECAGCAGEVLECA